MLSMKYCKILRRQRNASSCTQLSFIRDNTLPYRKTPLSPKLERFLKEHIRPKCRAESELSLGLYVPLEFWLVFDKKLNFQISECDE